MSGTFAQLQGVYASHGVITYPLTEAKTPAIRGYDRVGAKGSSQLALKFSEADALGFVAGRRNRLSVIDIDSPDERLVAEIQKRYGVTPLQVLTPSGGRHLYFRHSGEARRIRPLPDIDILGGGNCVAAGSIVQKGRYQIERGSLEDLGRLPPMRQQERSPADRIAVGSRNTSLFAHCMRAARHCDSLDALLDVARTYAEDNMTEPLPDAEIVRTATSAWRYEQAGENRFGSTGAWFPAAEVDALIGHQDALVLLTMLKARNAPDAKFWISNEFARSFGWPRKRLAAARADLLALRYVAVVRPAGRRTPALYGWTGRRQMAKNSQIKGGQK